MPAYQYMNNMIFLSEIIDLLPDQQIDLAEELGISVTRDLPEEQIVFSILEVFRSERGEPVIASGKLDIIPDGYGFIRLEQFNFQNGIYDIYISPTQIKKFQLDIGFDILGEVRAPKENKDNLALLKIHTVNNVSADIILQQTELAKTQINNSDFIKLEFSGGCDDLISLR